MLKLIRDDIVFKISLSKPVFFKIGRMSAVLSDMGIIGSHNNILTMLVIVGTISAMHSFQSRVGEESSSHDLAGDSLMIVRISASVASIMEVNGYQEIEFVTYHIYMHMTNLIHS